MFLDDDAGAAAERRDRLDALHPLAPRRGRLHRHAARRSPTCSSERPRTRLLPAAIPHDLHAITRGLVPELQSRGRAPRSYAAGTLRERLGLGRRREPLRRMSKRQIHLAAHFPGVNNTTVWSDPASGSHIDFASFVHLAQTAERAKFDFFFLAEGLRLREHARPDPRPRRRRAPRDVHVLAALAAVTERIGLDGTINTTYNEPYELARAARHARPPLRRPRRRGTSSQLATRSPARTSAAAATSTTSERYERGREILEIATSCWDSWRRRRDRRRPRDRRVPRRPDAGAVRHTARSSTSRAASRCRATPQGRPVIIQAGDSDDGPRVRRPHADGIFTAARQLEAGQAFYADVKGRMPRYGREPEELHDPARPPRSCSAPPRPRPRESAERGAPPAGEPADGDRVPRAGVGPRPLGVRPGRAAARRRARSRARHDHAAAGSRHELQDPVAIADAWRELAAAKGGLSIRELMIETTARQSFVGTPKRSPTQMDQHVQDGRLRRVHPRAAPHARRAGRVRRQGDAGAAGPRHASGPSTRARPCATTWAWHKPWPGAR